MRTSIVALFEEVIGILVYFLTLNAKHSTFALHVIFVLWLRHFQLTVSRLSALPLFDFLNLNIVQESSK